MTLLSIRGLSAFYGTFQALFDVSLEAAEGETVAVIGANGAGKSTVLRAIAGVLPVQADAVHFAGRAVGGSPAHELVDLGIVMVPEGRKIFPSLSVEENLRIGAYRGRTGHWTLERIYELFPVLAERKRQPGTNLSGGEQQMLAIGRGLMAEPKLLILDEPSLGLSPKLVEELFALIESISREGIALLLVEQNVMQSLQVAQRAYVLDNGAIVLQGSAGQVRDDPDLKRAYLGM